MEVNKMGKKSVFWFGMRLSPVAAQILYIASIIGIICVLISGITTIWYMFEAYMLWTQIDYIAGEFYTFSLIEWIMPVAVIIILFLFFWYNITVCRRAWRS